LTLHTESAPSANKKIIAFANQVPVRIMPVTHSYMYAHIYTLARGHTRTYKHTHSVSVCHKMFVINY
jgi:hypothetical protein